MNKFLKFTAILAIVAVSFSACSKTETPAETTTDSTETAAVETTGPIDAALLANLPAECPKANDISYKTNSTPEAKIDVKSAILTQAPMATEGRLLIGNYEIDYKKAYDNVTGGNVFIGLDLQQKEGSPLTIGTFTRTADTQKKVVPDLRTSESLIGFIGDKGQVDLIYKDDKVACGTVDIDDGYAAIKGGFVAEVVNEAWGW